MKFNRLREHLPYIGVLLVLTIIFFFQFFNDNLPPHDISSGYLPQSETLKKSVFEFGDWWPLWNPYGFSGTPLLMKPLPGLDSYQGILTLLIPNTILAVKLNYVVAFFLAGISMYSLLIYLRVGKKFAFISALIYILSGHVVKLLAWGWGTTLAGYSVLPLAFLFGIKAVKEKDVVRNSIIAGIILAILMRLSQDMKVTIWFGLYYGLYLMFNLFIKFSKQRLVKTLIVSFIILLVFFGLSAQRIIPNAVFIKETSRGDTPWEIASGRQLPTNKIFVRIIEPIYESMLKIQREGTGDHIGIIAFLLALFGVFKRFRDPKVLFFTLGAFVTVLVTSNSFNLYYLLWKFVPFFNSLRYVDRSLFMFVFFASILAGYGSEELFKKIKKNKNVFYSILVGLIVLNLWVFNYNHYTGGTTDNWSNVHEAREGNKILKYISEQPGLFRIQTWETRGVDWGTQFYNVPLGLEHIYQYDTTWYPPYMNGFLAVAFNNPSKLWGLLNVKYVTVKNEINVSGLKFKQRFEDCTNCFPIAPEWEKAWGPYLYENEDFLPRAYVVKNSILVIGEGDSKVQTIYALLLNSRFRPENSVIITGENNVNKYSLSELNKYSAIFLTSGGLEQESVRKLNDYVSEGGIFLPDITQNKQSVTQQEVDELFESFSGSLEAIDDSDVIMHDFDNREIRLNGEKGFLVYSEKFSVFDGWVANGDILNANLMNTAIYLEGDEGSLHFSYKPRSYVIGSTITLITLLLFLVYFVYSKIRRSKSNEVQ